jgi:Zn-dependent peptidase ImmA (M78 family)
MEIIYYRNETLEAIARRVIQHYDPSLLESPAPIPVEAIMEQVYGLKLDYQHIRRNGRVLGQIVFENSMIPVYEREGGEGYKLIPVEAGTVIIDMSLIKSDSEGRYRFTCAHELCHRIIHRDFFAARGGTAAMTETANHSEVEKTVERQANRMASYLLMPKGTVEMAFHKSVHNKSDPISSLAEQFNVSKEAMGYRLEELRLLS